MIEAYAVREAGGELERMSYDPGDLGPDEVHIRVRHCGVCHSDLSMMKNEWGMTEYPLVPGHEVVGDIEAVGDRVEHLSVGQTVGLGWFSGSCMSCRTCMRGDHNLCGSAEGTIVGRHGGFASHVRAHKSWAIPIPDGIDVAEAGPLFCGGITAYTPIVQHGITAMSRVGVVGIGGLGHLALQFLRAWGCKVVAFSSSASKADEARELGADEVVNSRDSVALEEAGGSLDMIVVTVNVPLDWEAYLGMLGPRGVLHFVGAVPEPIAVGAFSLIMGQKSVSGSPLGSPATTADMLDLCGRHGIAPVTEHFALTDVNDAVAHLEDGKARYRVVLDVA